MIPAFVEMMNGSDVPFDMDKADFSKISTNGLLAVSRVFHKSSVDVNETGTEAVAVTIADVLHVESSTRRREPEIIDFTCNRPFLFLIHDKQYENVFFVGKYVKPK